ncbi:thyrotropin-releasing hormone-degrading ectoenzyme-like [Cotesia glomerata]|uniref:Aminopeptidase n=1 Tax=Cotesia glomerata TaxID=32391 RepID=A0AAV7J9H0_COTGL|nr:thyrotropin-releasing hormone-degrading ectoenzyme-like [Cotesia glomerata]KAH0567684.1 hypothetical protein KQX54_011727 [Cotesia glomerata]
MLIDSKNDFNILIKILLCGTFITSTISKEWRKYYDPPLLPDIASPIHYIIKISPNIEDEKNLTFDGESIIDFEIKDATEVLTLNAKNLKIIGEISVRDQNRKWAVQNYSIDSKTDFLTIKFNEKLPEGNFTLYIFYNGKINTRHIIGLVYKTYDDDSDDEQWLLFSNFDSNLAREIMPCWDDPSMWATFEISIRHNRKYTAVSNTQFDSIMSDEKKFNFVWTHFEKTPRLSVRTLAFAMGDLEYLSDDSNAYRVWTSKNAKNHRKFFATIGGKAWRAMENITGIHQEDYVLKKIDIVVIPAPEEWDIFFWGLSILSKQNIPYDGYGNIETRNKFLISISQLLYDQWILNEDITLEKFDQSFLNMDLRHYVAVCIADQIEQSWDVKEKYFHNTRDLPNRLGFITRTVANIFGTYKFRNILKSFIIDNKFGGNKSVNLMDEYILASESKPMKECLQKALVNWMTTQGYPVIYVSTNATYETTITQSRFKANEFTKLNDRYWIPISCATQDYPNFEDLSDITWFDPDSFHLSFSAVPQNSWVICNKREFGDYRVNYDKNNWELIINYLKNDDYFKIHPLNRGQLIDDAFVFASRKYIDYDIPLKLMGYLHRETDYHPWVKFWRQLQHLYYNSPLRNSQYYENFKGYLLNQTSKLEADVLVDIKFYQDVHYLMKFQKASILKWACKFNSSRCQTYASEKLTKWLDNPKRYPIDDFYKPVLICSGVRNADLNTWNQLYKKYITDKEDDILYALGCTLKNDILAHFVRLVFNNTIEGSDDFSDSWTLFENIMIESDIGVDVVLDILIEIQLNFPDTDARYEFVRSGTFAIKNSIKNNLQMQKFDNIIQNDIKRSGSEKANSKLMEARTNINVVQSQSTFMAEFFSLYYQS